MDKQKTLKNVKMVKQILAECVENGALDSTLSWKLQRSLQIAESAVMRMSANDDLFRGIKI